VGQYYEQRHKPDVYMHVGTYVYAAMHEALNNLREVIFECDFHGALTQVWDLELVQLYAVTGLTSFD
jgi:hypothetical protein